MLAHAHRHHAGRGVGVVGRADGHRVDLLAHILEHLAVVEVLLRLGILRAHLVEAFAVDVAKGDNLTVLAGVVGVAVSLAANADTGEADLFIGRQTWRGRRARRADAEALPTREVPAPAAAVCLRNSRRSMVKDSDD